MKKGFTLVELLGVIAIIGIMALITVPIITNNLKSASKTDYEKFKNNLYLAAETYIENNSEKYNLNEPDDFVFIELQELVNNEYLNKKTINPLTKEPIVLTNTILVRILNDYTKGYEFTGTDANIRNYVLKDLKIHYDGYYKPIINDNQLIWKDLLNNSDGEIINGDGVSDWQENRIKLDNIDNYILSLQSSQVIPNDIDTTIEIVYGIKDKVEPTLLRNEGLGLYYFNLYSDGLIRSMVRNQSDSSNYWPAAVEKQMTDKSLMHTLTISMKQNEDFFDFQYYGDGRKLAMTFTNGKKSGHDNFKIGKDYQAELKSSVYIYSFRVYDRALEEEEIVKNHNVDKNRFDWRNYEKNN